MDDIAGVGRRLDELGIRWVAAIEDRGEGGTWFGTFEDPDGNRGP